jgi:hypothetical protein
MLDVDILEIFAEAQTMAAENPENFPVSTAIDPLERFLHLPVNAESLRRRKRGQSRRKQARIHSEGGERLERYRAAARERQRRYRAKKTHHDLNVSVKSSH